MRSTSLVFVLLSLASAGSHYVTAQQPVRSVDQASLDGQVFHASTYDVARERVVMFGKGQTWEWNGADWRSRTPAQSPSTRRLHCMAYDHALQRVLLFGGTTDMGWQLSAAGCSDTWRWDGRDWLQLLPVHSPSARCGHAMASDTARQRVVLFGGTNGWGNAKQDTWEWDGTDWQQHSPSQVPPGRMLGAMAYDALRGVTVLYGGYDFSGPYGLPSPRSDCWEWDGVDWQQVAAQPVPHWLEAPMMTYDVAQQRVVLFGNNPFGSQLYAWEWDGVSWLPHPATPSTGNRYYASIAHDAARGQTILCGGTRVSCRDGLQVSCNAGEPIRPVDTWALDGAAWTMCHIAEGAGAVALAASYDSVRNVFVSLSMHQGVCGVTHSMREWDGQRWTHHAAVPGGSGLSRFGSAMAFDSVRGAAVLFGGYSFPHPFGYGLLDDTWEWDGATWLARQPLNRPPGRGDHSMAFDSLRGVTVLFGGEPYDAEETVPLNDIWEYDGTNWQERSPSNSPSPRVGHAMAFDPLRGVTVMFGGDERGPSLLADTWEWDGCNWQQVAASGPPAASNHAMCWDPARQQLVTYVQDEVWGFDGAYWTQVQTAQPLPPANGGAMAYDVTRQALVVIGSGITRLIGDVAEPTSVPVGSGCPGTLGVPRLGSELLRIGAGEVRFTVDDVVAGTPVAFGLTATQQSVAIGGGCAPAALFADISNSYGHAEVAIPMPYDIALRGLDVWSQAAALDVQGAAFGISLTRALRMRIGD